ncbi:MAG: transporter [Solirubrobacterales bacterium]|nr:transporter [Solirubrobacterales bacterium]
MRDRPAAAAAGRHYAWTILVLCFVAILFAQGVRLSFGAFVRPWEEEFGVSRGTITLIGSLSFLVYGGSQPFVGRLVDRRGIRRTLVVSTVLVAAGLVLSAAAQEPWQLALAYGVVASLGFGGASGVAASVAVTYWFTQRRGLAFALVEAGFGAGQLILVPLLLVTISALGWRDALLAAAALLAAGVAPVLWRFLRDRPEDLGPEPVGGPAPQGAKAAAGALRPDGAAASGGAPAILGLGALLRSRAFWALGLPFFVCGVTTTGFVDTHLIPLAQDRGIPTTTTGLAVALLAAANVTGILASGPLSDRVDNRLLLAGLYATRGLSFVALLLFLDPPALIGFALLFGLVDFATVAPTQWLAAHYVHPRTVGLAFGCLNAVHQLGSALGAWLPGVVFDQTGSYDGVLVTSAIVLAVASLTCLSLPRALKVQPVA